MKTDRLPRIKGFTPFPKESEKETAKQAAQWLESIVETQFITQGPGK